MAEKDQSPWITDPASRAGHRSGAGTGPGGLGDSLAKSPRWKKSTLAGIQSHGTAASPGQHRVNQPEPSGRGEEIEKLEQAILELEAEKARLTERHQSELDARTAELLELQAAYEQFEQQSDDLLRELEQQNERLRDECRRQNPRSVL